MIFRLLIYFSISFLCGYILLSELAEKVKKIKKQISNKNIVITTILIILFCFNFSITTDYMCKVEDAKVFINLMPTKMTAINIDYDAIRNQKWLKNDEFKKLLLSFDDPEVREVVIYGEDVIGTNEPHVIIEVRYGFLDSKVYNVDPYKYFIYSKYITIDPFSSLSGITDTNIT